MDCPHCHSSSTTEREGRTVHGFRRFRCRECGRRFNERTGTTLNRVQVPTDIMFLVVFWRLRYKLSLRELAEMFLIRGIVFTHEAVRDWEAKLAPLLAEGLRKRRAGKAGRCWPGRIDRTARRQRVIDHDEAAPRSDLTSDDPAQRCDQAEQPEPAVFEHPVVSLPAQPRRQRQDRLRDMAARCQQGADDQLQKRQPPGLRAGLHDLADPSAKGRWEAGLVMRFHGVCGRLVSHPLHENRLPGDTIFKNPHRPSKSAELETPVHIDKTHYYFAVLSS